MRLFPVLAPALAALCGACWLGCTTSTGSVDGGGTNPVPDATTSTLEVTPQSGVPADGASRVIITVTLRDAAGVPVPNVLVDVTASGSGNLLSLPAMPTNAAGVATATLASRVAERKTVRAHALLSNDTRTTLTARAIVEFIPATTATQLAFVVQPLDTVDGARLDPAVTVEIQDAMQRRVPGATSSVTLSLQGCTAALAGTLTRPAVDGAAAFVDMTVAGVSTGCVLRAVSSGLPAVDSAAFDVLASARGSLRFVQQPSPVLAGHALTPAVEVAVLDPSGAPQQAPTLVTVSVLDGLGLTFLSGTTAVTSANGRVRFVDLSLDPPATGVTLRASAGGYTSAVSQRFDVLAPTTARLRFTAVPSQAVAGQLLSPAVVVALEDANGVPLTQTPAVVTLQAVGGSPGVTGTVTHTTVGGQATFDAVALTLAGSSVQLQATAPGVAGAVSTAINVTPGALHHFNLRHQGPVSAGVPVDVVVTAVDAFENVVATHTGALTWAVTDALAILPLNTSFESGGGGVLTAPVTLKTGGRHTLTVTGSGVTGTLTLDVLGGAGVALSFASVPAAAQVRQTLSPAVTVHVVDAYGNVDPNNTAVVTLAVEDGPVGTIPLGTLSQPAVSGVATFADLAFPDETAALTLRATATGLLPAVSPVFAVDDTTPPAAVTDLSVSTFAATSLTVRFTAPGDDGTQGTAATYELRHATSPITPQDFAQATPVLNLSTPSAAGSVEQVTVDNLSSNTTHHLALRVLDGAGNASFSVASFATLPCPAGYAGADCTGCDVGFHLDLQGACVDACQSPNPCSQPPTPSCNGNSAVTGTGPGTCSLQAASPYFSCAYSTSTQDCTTSSRICVAGACIVDPCQGVTCPPRAAACEPDRLTLTSYAAACVPDGPSLFHCQDVPTTTRCQDLGAVCFLGACATATPVSPQDVLFTELLHTPSAAQGHFVELTNITPSLLDLSGVVLRHSNGSTFTLPSSPPLLVAPQGRVVLGDSTNTAVNGNIPVDVAWGAFVLGQSGTLTLERGATVLEQLVYGAAFPNTAGTAMQLASVAMTPDAHVRSWYWCNATTLLPNGDKGTPGAPNNACGITTTQPVDSCRLNAPYDLGLVDATNLPLASATFFEPGATNRSSTSNDFYPHVQGQAGVGQTTDASSPSWTFVDGAFNAAYVTSGPLDEMVASLAFPSSGLWRWAWRFRLLDPVTGVPGAWTYCDQAGVANAATGNWGTIQVRPGVSSVSHNVVPRGSTFTVQGAGLLGLTSVTVGGVSQPFQVLAQDSVTVGPVDAATPLGTQPLQLWAGATSSTPRNLNVVNLVASRSLVAHGASFTLSGAPAGTATQALVGSVVHPVVIQGDTATLVLQDVVPTGAAQVSLSVTGGNTAPLPITVLHLTIDEVDSDQVGTDTAEFVEIGTGVPNVTLTGYSLVLFNGSTDTAYRVVDLDGLTTNAQGLLLVGGPSVMPTPQFILPGTSNIIQNGPDAVALYDGVPADASPATATGLLDAVLHSADTSEDLVLLSTLLGTGPGALTLRESTSNAIRRCAPTRLDARAFGTGAPTPLAANGCP